MVTYYVVLGFQKGKRGMLIADDPREARDQGHCMMLAQRIAESRVGVVAFSRTGDPSMGDWDDAVVIWQHGSVPEEALAMAS